MEIHSRSFRAFPSPVRIQSALQKVQTLLKKELSSVRDWMSPLGTLIIREVRNSGEVAFASPSVSSQLPLEKRGQPRQGLRSHHEIHQVSSSMGGQRAQTEGRLVVISEEPRPRVVFRRLKLGVGSYTGEGGALRGLDSGANNSPHQPKGAFGNSSGPQRLREADQGVYQATDNKRVAGLDPERQEASLLDAKRCKAVSQKVLYDERLFISPVECCDTVPHKESGHNLFLERQATQRDARCQAARCDIERQASNRVERPSERGAERSSRRDVERPLGRDPERPAKRDVKCTAIRDVERPSRRSVERSSGSDLERPTKSDVECPARRDVERPTERGVGRPSKRDERHIGRDLESPAERDVKHPPRRDVKRPTKQDVERPTRRDIESPPGRDVEWQAARQDVKRQAVRGAERQTGRDVERNTECDTERRTSFRDAGSQEVRHDFEDESRLRDDTSHIRCRDQEHLSSNRFDRERFAERQALDHQGD
ncbi:eukaryotic translation initiation factor 3 subunit A-like [Palaemon carinicauda]|uniref:eukaryotic translation initiation factor 3 subunit A-like n=1 Tax=Palaemon carinicauda TaxID=392227 RepID=UPI0035B5903E